jgi:hypothetical protein
MDRRGFMNGVRTRIYCCPGAVLRGGINDVERRVSSTSS